jgi:hypothetical protein
VTTGEVKRKQHNNHTTAAEHHVHLHVSHSHVRVVFLAIAEGTLDVSLISGLAPGVITFVSNTDTSSDAEEGDGFGPAMLSWMTGLIQNSTTKGLPNVISLSLGSLSWDSCNMLCEGVVSMSNYTYVQCQSYMQSQRQVCM